MIIGTKWYPSLFLHGCETVTGRTGNDTSTNQNKNTKATGSITIIIMNFERRNFIASVKF